MSLRFLYYEGVPFRCHRCHSAEHLVAQCNRPFSGINMTKGRRDWSKEGGTFKKAREATTEKRPIKDCVGSFPVGMVPRVVQLREPKIGGLEEAVPNNRLESQVSNTALSMPSGTGTSVTPFFPEIYLTGVLLSSRENYCVSQSPSRVGLTSSKSMVICTLPKVKNSSPDPLVTTLSSFSGSSKENNV